MDMLTLSHVNKRFGEKQVLRDVSFSVPEHAVYGFVGQNGAGKTTTMKLILGLLAADGGEICVNGIPVRYGNTETNRFIGYLPDVPEFYHYMTPSEYLSFCGEITGMPPKEIRVRTEELLCLTGLEKENRRIRGFSRGMKQRLGVAQGAAGHSCVGRGAGRRTLLHPYSLGCGTYLRRLCSSSQWRNCSEGYS